MSLLLHFWFSSLLLAWESSDPHPWAPRMHVRYSEETQPGPVLATKPFWDWICGSLSVSPLCNCLSVCQSIFFFRNKKARTDTLIQQTDPSLVMLASHMSHFQSSSVLVTWESSRKRLKCLGPCTLMGGPEEALSPWLWPGLAAAIVAIWGLNGWMEDLVLSLFLSLTLPLNKWIHKRRTRPWLVCLYRPSAFPWWFLTWLYCPSLL